MDEQQRIIASAIEQGVRFQDKEKIYGPGPWVSEPDRVEWRSRGFPCLALRNRHGVWCGYVAVSEGHPWYGVGYDDCKGPDGDYVDVHGGLTYADTCARNICHVPEPGEPDNVYWVGFDCNHSGDFSPGMSRLRTKAFNELMKHEGEEYRDVAYVRAEVERLAEQAEAVAKKEQ